MVATPAYVRRFCEELTNTRLDYLQLDLCTPPVQGSSSILTKTRIKYNQDLTVNLLGRNLEFKFQLPGQQLELSLQLYWNDRKHWRLFCLTNAGMLFSINLSLLREQNSILQLEQTIRISTQSISSMERVERADKLCNAFWELGFQIEGRKINLGMFDSREGKFQDTTSSAFLRDFTLASLVKGHYMGNKKYQLPGMPRFDNPAHETVRQRVGTGRAVPPGLRYQVLE